MFSDKSFSDKSFLFSKNLDKAPQKVTNYLKREKIAREGRGKYMNKLEESIKYFKWCKNGSEYTRDASNDAANATYSGTTSATGDITWSRDIYIYGVGAVDVLATGDFFFAYDTIFYQPAHDEQVKE